MQKWTWRTLMVPILILAAALRLYGNDWDRYEHYHPDERYISWVASTIRAPDSLADAFTPDKSTFNPYYWPAESNADCTVAIRDQPRDFAYGHLPLYLGVIATNLVETVVPDFETRLTPTCRSGDGTLIATQLDRAAAVGRVLTALVDVGSVLFVFLIGRRLFGAAEGAVAALLLALTVTHIQLAHFFTTDPYMTFFVLAALYCMIRSQQSSYPGLMLGLAAMLTGFAIGSKFSGVMLVLPLLLAWLWSRGAGLAHTRQGFRLFISLVGTLLAVFVAFAITNPFAVRDFSCEVVTNSIQLGPLSIPQFNLRSCFLYNIGKQATMVNGSSNFPFTRQYAGTLPYLYFLEMQLRWGMGYLAGGLGILGSIWIVIRAIRHVRWQNVRNEAAPLIRRSMRPIWLILAFCIPFFISTGNFFVKFMRYWQPLVPFMLIFGVGMVWSIRNRWVKRTILTVVTIYTALFALSFVSIYQKPHPWVVASLWIYDNVAPDSTILSERWGDRLPSTLMIDGTRLSSSGYRFRSGELTWLSGIAGRDNEEKWVENLNSMASADYLVIDSNRIYGVVPRQPDLYPISHRVYEPLFDGSLGYEVVFVTNRMPHIGQFHLKPDYFSWPGVAAPPAVKAFLDSHPGVTLGRADESFTLYDQSMVMVFENKSRHSAETLNEIIAGINQPPAENSE